MLGIARELHDQVGQSLTALQLMLISLQQSAVGPANAMHLRECQQVLDVILECVHSLCLELRPPLLDDVGLVAAARAHLREFGERAGIKTRLVAEALPPDLNPEAANTCFRILQEALTNVARHARASSVTAELHLREGVLHLRVRDDGQGFDVAARRGGPGRRDCLGLLGMEERTVIAGGGFEVNSTTGPGQFTEVKAFFPIDRLPAEAPRLPLGKPFQKPSGSFSPMTTRSCGPASGRCWKKSRKWKSWARPAMAGRRWSWFARSSRRSS